MAFSISANDMLSASRSTGTIRPALGADGDADVVVVVVDDVVAVDPGVDRGIRLERLDGRLDEERHEAQADAVLRLEQLLVARAEVDHAGHVGLVEGGQDRGGLLGLDQALGDPLAEAAHPLPRLAVGRRARGRLRAAAVRRWRPAARRSRAGAAVAGDFQVRQHVSLGDPSAGAGGGDLGGVDLLLGHQPADGRREGQARRRWAWPEPGGRRRGRAVGRGRRCRRGGCGGRRPAWPPGRACRSVAPMATVSPSATATLSTPVAAAGTTLLALSVSSSKSGSPALTSEPSGLSQRDEDSLGDRLADAGDGDRERRPWSVDSLPGGHGRQRLAPGSR